MKVLDKYKEKQLLKKFDLISNEMNQNSQDETTINPTSSNKSIEINWKKNFSKKSYKSWVFDNFYMDLQLLLKKRNAEIIDYKFIKTKDDKRKLYLEVRIKDLILKHGLIKLLNTTKFEEKIHSPIIKKSGKDETLYKILFSLLEEEETNEFSNDEQSKDTSKTQRTDNAEHINRV